MSISPKLSIYINIFVALLAAIVSGTVSFTGLVPDPISHAIVTWAAFILSIYSVANAALHSVSSASDGPLTNIKIKFEKLPAKEVIAVIMILGFGGFMAINTTVSFAAPHPKHRIIPHNSVVKPLPVPIPVAKPVDKPAIGEVVNGVFEPYEFVPAVELTPAAPIQPTQPIGLYWDNPAPIEPAHLAAALPLEASPKMNGVISDVWKKLQGITLQDLQYANNLAVANQDTVASSCYSSLITLIQKSQMANIDPATGQPMALPSIHLVTDLENIIIIYRELQPTSTTSVACAPFMNAVKISSMSALLTGLSSATLAGGLALP